MDLIVRMTDLLFIIWDAESGVPVRQRRGRAPGETGSV